MAERHPGGSSEPRHGGSRPPCFVDKRGPLYVVAIGAPTNVSNALLLAPEILDRVIVIWLGGNALHWPSAREFNLRQDLYASAPAVRLRGGPGARPVRRRSRPSNNHPGRDRPFRPPGGQDRRVPRSTLRGKRGRCRRGVEGHLGPGCRRVGLDASWSTTVLAHSPVLTDGMTWSSGPRRHLIGEVVEVRRDAIFADLFTRLAAAAELRGPGRSA